ncbi:PLDc N-terminal domain-containing protein [Marinicrinis lubricantis]|uniref:PLDc N-terminal domain-containing protein n=1 Tax=Marinicrinis lubricantis TaxID=2086470 RepID=A0ABW1ITW2_9BACL
MGALGIVSGVLFLFAMFGLLLLVLNVVTSIWAYHDALRKGNSKEYALIVLVGTLIFPVVGLIVYLLIRSDRY